MAPQSPRHRTPTTPARRRTTRFARLRCEQLEDRTTPALFSVQQPVGYSSLNNNGCVAVADFNKDGFADMVLANFGTDYSGGAGTTITVLYGQSNGSFNQVVLSTGGANVAFVTVADINGDGWQDVVAVNANRQNTGSFSVFRNDQAGNLVRQPTTYSTFGNNSSWVGLADVTGDGVLDVVVASFGKDSGSGTVIGNNVTIFQGNADAQGHGNFTFNPNPITTLTPTLTFIPYALAIGDFDDDGIQDIAACVPGTPPDFGQPASNGSIYVFHGTGGGGFNFTGDFDSGGVFPGAIQAVDVNNDGKEDLVIANAGDGNTVPEFKGNSVGVLLNVSTEGHASFGLPTSLTANTYGTFAVAAADFNLDGKMDIAAVNYGSQYGSTPAAFVSVYMGNGNGTFTSDNPGNYNTLTGSSGGQFIAVGDFDHNGTPDLVVAHSTDVVGLLLNTAAVAPAAPKVVSTSVNGGAVQRSTVTSVSVTFSTVVSLPANAASAFTLSRIGGGQVTIGSATVATVNGATVVTLSGFSGSDASQGGSLNDGRYTLTALAGQITAGGQQLDGNGDGTAGDNYVFADSGTTSGNQLYRLYGDGDGNRVVNQADLTLFRNAYGSGDPTFDVDGNGVVNANDLTAFRANFGMSI
jgi:hypothetical protein